MKFESKHFNQFENATLTVFRNYCYLHRFYINLNLYLDKTWNTILLKAVVAKWNIGRVWNKLNEMIRYHSLSRHTRKHKQQLNDIFKFCFASNFEINIENFKFQIPFLWLNNIKPFHVIMSKQFWYMYQPKERFHYEYELKCRSNEL